ncbi:unnamed protein product [Adineta ricciae]|uniref:G-protein coupled receptors family 1 profile domain-containing protein n=1 Tax=Adineta ricciae TaxID=249248 RepID=A0A815UPS4_ADIRI|nr:unnamed protein product [Adineta ricciae]CAF1522341.1 unnamed protein product [Adineta ricciae]
MNVTISARSDADLIAELTVIGKLFARYMLLVMIILSSVGNVLNVLIFSQSKLRSNPCTVYLLAASYTNLIWTVAAVCSRFLSTYNLDFSAQISGLCKIRHFIFFSFSSISVWMMTLATFDRFLISSTSTKYRQFSSFRNTYRLIGITTIILSLNYANLFYCANIKGTPPSSSCTSITSTACGFYNELSRIMTSAIIPGIVILVFGLGTIRHLKQIRTTVTTTTAQTQSQQRMRKTDQELIRMLIGQIILIFISWIPHAAERLYTVITLYDVKSPLRTTQDNFLDQIIWTETTLDSSLSFYVYLFTGGILFRKTFREMFRRGTITPTNEMSLTQRQTRS